MTKTKWTEAEIAEQQKIVNAAPNNALYYERGKLDCMLGNVICPPASTVEQLQWEQGWRDEYTGRGVAR